MMDIREAIGERSESRDVGCAIERGKGARLYANERRARAERATQRVSPSIRELSSVWTLDTAQRLVPPHELDAQSQLSVHAESAHASLRLARRSSVSFAEHIVACPSCLSAAHSHTAAA